MIWQHSLRTIQLKTVFLAGLGIGMVATSLSLAPGEFMNNNKYKIFAVIGFVMIVSAGLLSLYGRRKEIHASGQQNLKTLFTESERMEGKK